MNKTLRDAWSEYLISQPWDYFLTITFREPVARHRALATLYFCDRTLRRLKPRSVFLGAEEHLSTYLHIHGLFRCGTIPGLENPASEIFQSLFERYGRSKVEIPRSQADVATYVTKYATKNLAEYSFY